MTLRKRRGRAPGGKIIVVNGKRIYARLPSVKNDAVDVDLGNLNMSNATTYRFTNGQRKADDGKIRWDLLPWDGLEEVAKAMMFGAAKYGERSWLGIENPGDRCWAAAMRHLVKWRGGEVLDPESHLSHLAHVVCEVLFMIELCDVPLTNKLKERSQEESVTV